MMADPLLLTLVELQRLEFNERLDDAHLQAILRRLPDELDQPPANASPQRRGLLRDLLKLQERHDLSPQLLKHALEQVLLAGLEAPR